MPDGRLILRRSVLIRCLAVPVAVVGAIWMVLLALQMLDPLTRGVVLTMRYLLCCSASRRSGLSTFYGAGLF